MRCSHLAKLLVAAKHMLSTALPLRHALVSWMASVTARYLAHKAVSAWSSRGKRCAVSAWLVCVQQAEAALPRVRRAVEMLRSSRQRRAFQALLAARAEVDLREAAVRHYRRRRLSMAWSSWRAGSSERGVLRSAVARLSVREAGAAMRAFAGHAAACTRERQLLRMAGAALRGSSVRRAWLSWASFLGQRALMACAVQVLLKHQNMCAHAALLCWRVLAQEWQRQRRRLWTMLAKRSLSRCDAAVATWRGHARLRLRLRTLAATVKRQPSAFRAMRCAFRTWVTTSRDTPERLVLRRGWRCWRQQRHVMRAVNARRREHRRRWAVCRLWGRWRIRACVSRDLAVKAAHELSSSSSSSSDEEHSWISRSREMALRSSLLELHWHAITRRASAHGVLQHTA